MKEKGIIMSGDHPKLILDGTKTQTRRVLTPQPDLGLDPFDGYSHIEVGKYYPTMVDRDGMEYPGDEIFRAYTDDGEWGWKCPYGQVGDRLWVRETFCIADNLPVFKANFYELYKHGGSVSDIYKWRPSIFMPRWASRITLEITELRVERVQEITEEDAEAEGVSWSPVGSGENYETISAVENFAGLWDSLNSKRGYGWEVNPWVWVIGFRRVE